MTQKISSIALFGTSADPPTLGHQILLNELIKIYPKVITWASDNPGKKHVIPLRKRSQLLKILVEGISNPQLEQVQSLSSPWTIHTLQKANKLWPESKFSFVIGSDLTAQVPKWLNAKSVLHRTTIAIAIREGWPINREHVQEIENLGGRIEILPIKIPASSSSKFRESHQRSLIPSELLPILVQENLYGITEIK